MERNREDSNARITIEDTGLGIPDEVKERIFQPLVTTKSRGQGFGLAVCKRLIEALKGEISFVSQKGKGTKFIIKLPLEDSYRYCCARTTTNLKMESTSN